MKRRYVVDVARCSPDDLMQNMISGWDAVVIHGSKRGCLYVNINMIVETFFLHMYKHRLRRTWLRQVACSVALACFARGRFTALRLRPNVTQCYQILKL